MSLTRIEAAAISGAIGTTQLTDGSVTSAKIADGTITNADIAANTILTSNLQLSDDWGLVTGSITATDDFGALV